MESSILQAHSFSLHSSNIHSDPSIKPCSVGVFVSPYGVCVRQIDRHKAMWRIWSWHDNDEHRVSGPNSEHTLTWSSVHSQYVRCNIERQGLHWLIPNAVSLIWINRWPSRFIVLCTMVTLSFNFDSNQSKNIVVIAVKKITCWALFLMLL